ncbi:ABC transporter ATP-binding protein [Actinomadura verrucosospora]|uniref:ABC transporter ATP-binding protein n=1 Tax=Actinomadura verrucosospora TaxID=46165 RepID=A0A7D3ZG95_ACTVE|nr:ABC transporter ATP-binding protein [Actinomadura verrucosospora]
MTAAPRPDALGPALGPALAAAPRPVLGIRDVSKVYGEGDTAVHALRGVSLTVEPGDYVAIMGASGSGKSTLMNIIGCLDVPSGGRYLLDGIDVGALDERRLAILRNRRIGFVFQSFNLIPRMTAQANVELPLAYGGVKGPERRRRALAALREVGLADRTRHEPNELSGGQQQRVAIARALVTAPTLLLADEPTGALDSGSTADVLAVFDRLSLARRTIVVITHEDDVAAHAKRVVRLVDGRVVDDVRRAPVAGPPPAASWTTPAASWTAEDASWNPGGAR